MFNSKLFFTMVIAGFLAFSSTAQAGVVSNLVNEMMVFNSQPGASFTGVGVSSSELVAPSPELGVIPSENNGGPSEEGGDYCRAECNPPPVSVVPEPETYAMLLAGLCLVGFAARRRVSNTFT